MPVVKNAGDKGAGHIDTMFIHYSPPRLVEARRWARGGDVDRLQRAALAGHGSRLMRLRLPASTSRARNFLKELPALVDKCDQLHEAVVDGDLQQLRSILDRDPARKRLALCRDRAGVGLLHKSVYYDYNDITKYLIDNYPTTVHMKDSDGRTPLHYAAVAGDPEAVSAVLIAAGAERAPQDLRQRTPAYYLTRAALLDLPKPNPNSPSTAELVIKPSNIRIWCHDRDLGRLQQVVWRGEGGRLRNEMSSQPAVKKFLEAVPYIMGTIKDIHTSLIENDVEKLKAITEDPVTPVIFSSRDVNGLTALHKAAGFGNKEAVEYIAGKYPEGTKLVDNDGRTPLHWAALAKDDDEIYNIILEHGAPEGKLDNKMKSAGFYKTRPGDIDKSLLNTVPEAPRTASLTYPSSWDWDLLRVNSNQNQRPKKKIPTPIPEVQPEMETNKEDTPETPDTPDDDKSEHMEIVPDSPETVTHEMLIVDNPDTFDDNTEHLMMDHEMERDRLSENDITEAEEGFEKSVNDDLDNEDDVENVADGIEDRLKTASLPRNIPSPEVEQNNNDEVEKEVEEEADEEFKDETHYEEEYEEEEQEDETEVAKETDVESKVEGGNRDNLKTPKHNEHLYNHKHEEESKEHLENHQDMHEAPHVEDEDVEEYKNHHKTPQRTPEPVSKSDSEDHDDDDVHVRGESESEYDELHKADTADVLDVEKMKKNSNIADLEDLTGRISQGSESIIEGVVNADPEVDSLDAEQKEMNNSANENDVNIEDEEVQMLIDTCNMEQLAALVLNGEGERLVGQMSQNSELQAFLDNVPSYMNKIKRVHMAARGGGLKELQSALDRRKFAIARDRCSPRGATPLHVAVIFGRTPILRYLAARFPETLSAVDFDGRTALHYAAVLKDNGHYYNLLQSMGANPKDQDDESHTPEDFLDNDKYLTHRGLLKDFGADESTINEMLNDKEPANSDNNNGQVDIPIFRTEEGRYLASSLGDPLIKGLTEVANQRPKDPIAFLATYLYNFANQNKTRLKTQESSALINSEPPVVNEQQQSSNVNPLNSTQNLTANHGQFQVPPTPPAPNTPGAPEAAFSSDNRDEHGQSMLHFAAARSHGRGALLQLVREAGVSPAYRDELYRTARDVSIQANIPENTNELDRWLLEVTVRGETDKINDLIVEGYDHILDVVDDDGTPIIEVVNQRGQSEMFSLLSEIPSFEETRENLHQYIRQGDVTKARAILVNQGTGLQSGRTMAIAKNGFGRSSLHIAVLAQQDELAEYIARAFPETLRIGDNLERTALHYAMGADNVESLSRILIKAGAKRVLKDLKGRQPSYYFMNKSEILRLKEEESF